MYNLLKVEFYKLKKFQLGYITIFTMFIFGYIYGDGRIIKRVFELTDSISTVFSCIVCDTSFVFLISIIAALFISVDFGNRTICNEIKLGYSRFHILLSRMAVVCVFAILFHLTFIISAIVGFFAERGVDTSLFCIENAFWLLTILIQLSAVTSGVVLISFIAKKVAEAVALSALYTFVCCNILRNFISAKIYTLSCFSFVQNNNSENLVSAIVSALVTMIVFLVIGTIIFNKAEVK